jgi:hypothetical protein
MAKRTRSNSTPDKMAESLTPTDISSRAHTIARLIDRLCRAPGVYSVTLKIPTHSRAPWEVQVNRVEAIRKMDVERR